MTATARIAVCLVALATPALLSTTSQARPLSYVVTEPGDLTAQAARLYGRKRGRYLLAAANDLPLDAKLEAGAKLKVPVSYQVYLRKPTSAAALAKRHLGAKKHAELLAMVNGLNAEQPLPAFISLTVPSLIQYQAGPSETFASIAERFLHGAGGAALLETSNPGVVLDGQSAEVRVLVPIFEPWTDSSAVGSRIRAYKRAQSIEHAAAEAAQACAQRVEAAQAKACPELVAVTPTRVHADPPEPSASAATAKLAEEVTPPFPHAFAPPLAPGVNLFRRGAYPPASAFFASQAAAIEGDPQLRRAALLWLANCQLALGKNQDAANAVRQALAASPLLELDPAVNSPKLIETLTRVRHEAGG